MSEKSSPLFDAICLENVEKVRQLLQSSDTLNPLNPLNPVDPNERDSFGQHPLYVAACKDNPELLQVLIEGGSDASDAR